MSRNGTMHPTPAAPVLDDHIAKPLIKALEVFRAVEGEKALNMLLHEMLLKSNATLQGFGVQSAFRESAELESLRAQLKRAQETNAHGNQEYRKLQHAANQAVQSLAVIADADGADSKSDLRETASMAVKAWEAETNRMPSLAS